MSCYYIGAVTLYYYQGTSVLTLSASDPMDNIGVLQTPDASAGSLDDDELSYAEASLPAGIALRAQRDSMSSFWTTKMAIMDARMDQMSINETNMQAHNERLTSQLNRAIDNIDAAAERKEHMEVELSRALARVTRSDKQRDEFRRVAEEARDHLQKLVTSEQNRLAKQDDEPEGLFPTTARARRQHVEFGLVSQDERAEAVRLCSEISGSGQTAHQPAASTPYYRSGQDVKDVAFRMQPPAYPYEGDDRYATPYLSETREQVQQPFGGGSVTPYHHAVLPPMNAQVDITTRPSGSERGDLFGVGLGAGFHRSPAEQSLYRSREVRNLGLERIQDEGLVVQEVQRIQEVTRACIPLHRGDYASRRKAVETKEFTGETPWRTWYTMFAENCAVNGWSERDAYLELRRLVRNGPGQVAIRDWVASDGQSYVQLVNALTVACGAVDS